MLQGQGCLEQACNSGCPLRVANDRLNGPYIQLALLHPTAITGFREECRVNGFGFKGVPDGRPRAVSLKILASE